ncbi:MAG: family transcriptional regulator [Nocardioidaceae bacterium]|nr:family transcriptional regulator [Nocardioidaceae bacterium]
MSVEVRPSSRDSPGSTASLRTQNLRRVLDVLRDAGSDAVTQADLTRTTGLAAGTVSSIVRELSAALIVDTVAGSGRRGTTVRLARGAGLVGGVDFGHSHLRVAIGDMAGTILAERTVPLASGHDHEEGLGRAVTLLDELLAEIDADRSELRNIGLGLPAPISDDVVMSSAILPGWVGVNARQATTRHFGRAVQLDNDANLGALAEHRHGAGRGVANMVFVKVSSGVGAGLILGDRLYRGATGISGEIGHLTVDDQGPLCRCGSRGCLETYTASTTAPRMLAEQMPGATLDDIVEAARAGNPAALRVFEDAGVHLGWGLAALSNVINPELIVVGGDMARAGDLFLEPARTGLRRHVLADAAATPVVAAELGDRASAIGAMLLASDATDLLAD